MTLTLKPTLSLKSPYQDISKDTSKIRRSLLRNNQSQRAESLTEQDAVQNAENTD